MAVFVLFFISHLVSTFVRANCYDPAPAHPVPSWVDDIEVLTPAFEAIDNQLEALVSNPIYDTSSYSISVTTNTRTVWSNHHTAKVRDPDQPGNDNVDGDAVYRIASISKVFTTLGIFYQHAAGNLSLDTPILNYVPEFAEDDAGKLPWKDITLRSLASQLSGIPREFAQSDLINGEYGVNPLDIGLPPVSRDGLLQCDEYINYERGCNRSELIDTLRKQEPIYAPNLKSTYSNVAFVLLSLALENVTGIPYREYMRTAIFEPLNMTSTGFDKPPDSRGVIPILEWTGKPSYYWPVDLGIQAATGGIYSTANDLMEFQRYIVTHYNALVTGLNWFQPQSFGEGFYSFYGMPWETSRFVIPSKGSRRPVNVATKAGGLPGYSSHIVFLPQYGLSYTALIGGRMGLRPAVEEVIMANLVPAAESAIFSSLAKTHAGFYMSPSKHIKSSLMLKSSPAHGLEVKSFVSNSTDVLQAMATIPSFACPEDTRCHAQLVPTLLYKDEKKQRGEIWRLLIVPERPEAGKEKIWDDHCITDVDEGSYAGFPLNEVVFWLDERIVELPAWRLMMTRITDRKEEDIIVQDPKLDL